MTRLSQPSFFYMGSIVVTQYIACACARTHVHAPMCTGDCENGARQGDREQRNRVGDRQRDFQEGCICCPRRSPCEEVKRQSCSMAVFWVRNGVGHGQTPRSASMPSLSCARKSKACQYQQLVQPFLKNFFCSFLGYKSEF